MKISKQEYRYKDIYFLNAENLENSFSHIQIIIKYG